MGWTLSVLLLYFISWFNMSIDTNNIMILHHILDPCWWNFKISISLENVIKLSSLPFCAILIKTILITEKYFLCYFRCKQKLRKSKPLSVTLRPLFPFLKILWLIIEGVFIVHKINVIVVISWMQMNVGGCIWTGGMTAVAKHMFLFAYSLATASQYICKSST